MPRAMVSAYASRGDTGAFSSGVTDMIPVFSTPKNAGNHARQIRRAVDGCPHRNTVAQADRPGGGLG